MNRIEILRKYVDNVLLKMTDNEERRCAYVHLYGVEQACSMIAIKRGEDVELSMAAGMLHDIYSYSAMDSKDHAHKGATMAIDILVASGQFHDDEIKKICTAIYSHSDKGTIDSSFDEVLKDADVMQHYFYNPLVEVKESERVRLEKLIKEFGLA